jgi:hypothetical protein
VTVYEYGLAIYGLAIIVTVILQHDNITALPTCVQMCSGLGHTVGTFLLGAPDFLLQKTFFVFIIYQNWQASEQTGVLVKTLGVLYDCKYNLTIHKRLGTITESGLFGHE